jgi:hypothetical protein
MPGAGSGQIVYAEFWPPLHTPTLAPSKGGWARAAISVGGGDDFYRLSEESEYSLPFKVWGYFNLVGCELLDGSDVYHHRLWLLSSNGKMRQQTNEEAAADAPF